MALWHVPERRKKAICKSESRIGDRLGGIFFEPPSTAVEFKSWLSVPWFRA
jgi:hypothetical protein